MRRMLKRVVVLLPYVQEREPLAHHVEVNSLPAQLRTLGRDGLRSSESSKRVDSVRSFVFRNLRENIVVTHVNIGHVLSRPAHTALWPCVGETARLRARGRPFLDGASFHSTAAYSAERVLIPCCAVFFTVRCCFVSGHRERFLPQRDHVGNAMVIVCGSIVVIGRRGHLKLHHTQLTSHCLWRENTT